LPTGDGANWAILDGVELADAIAAGKSLAAYERRICRRAASTAWEGDIIMEVMSGDAQGFADMLSAFGPPPISRGPIAIYRWASTLGWFMYRLYARPTLSRLPLLSRLL